MVVGERRGAARDKHRLYVQGRHLASPASDGSLARAIVRSGASLVTPPDATGLVLGAIPVVHPDGSVTLVDADLNHELRLVQSRLARGGTRVLDCPTVTIDPARAHVRIPDAAARWRVDPTRFDAAFPPRPGDDDLGPLDGPVGRVVVATAGAPDSPAAAVAAAVGLVRREGRLDVRDVDRLARLLTEVPLVPYVFTEPVPLAELLA